MRSPRLLHLWKDDLQAGDEVLKGLLALLLLQANILEPIGLALGGNALLLPRRCQELLEGKLPLLLGPVNIRRRKALAEFIEGAIFGFRPLTAIERPADIGGFPNVPQDRIPLALPNGIHSGLLLAR